VKAFAEWNYLRTTLRALTQRNFRIFFVGQSISLIGTWMQQVAVSWMIYRLTGSAFVLGLYGFASQIPSFLLTPFAGVAADHWNRHRTLVIVQSAFMIQAFTLALLSWTGTASPAAVITLGAVAGILASFDVPARQAFLIELVEKRELLGNAIALNASLFNGARLIGPAIAGLVIAASGETVCFVLNAISYVAILVALARVRIVRKAKIPRQTGFFTNLKEGFVYAYTFKPFFYTLGLLAVVCFFGMPFTVFLPIFSKEILAGNSSTLGFLVAATGFGAFTAAMALASKKDFSGLPRLISLSSGLFAVSLLLFSFSTSFRLSFVLMFFAGFGIMLQMGSTNTIIQAFVVDDKRGRMASFYTMAFMGTVPLGSLAMGVFAKRFGMQGTLAFSAVACLIFSLLFFSKLPSLKKALLSAPQVS